MPEMVSFFSKAGSYVSILIAGLPDTSFAHCSFERLAEQRPMKPIEVTRDWLSGSPMSEMAISLAVTIATMVGFLMVTGRMEWRFGAKVTVVCGLLLCAVAISLGGHSSHS